MNSSSETPDYGPTVVEAADARLREIKRLMEELQVEKFMLLRRKQKYKGSKMLEAERIATETEPFQRVGFISIGVIIGCGISIIQVAQKLDGIQVISP